MILLPAKRKMANGAPILPALAAGARPAVPPAQSMIQPLVLPKAVNGVPAPMAVAGALPAPQKPAPAHPHQQLRHHQLHRQQLQFPLAGPTRRLTVKNIRANGALTPARTVTAPVLVIWPIKNAGNRPKPAICPAGTTHRCPVAHLVLLRQSMKLIAR